MKKISILYESAEGQTEKVAQHIAETLSTKDCQVTVVKADTVSDDQLAETDGILLGGSIHAGRHNGKLVHFTETHKTALSAKPTGFFLVCLTAKMHTPEAKETVTGFIKDFETRTGFTPAISTAFGGALLYTQYGFVKRNIMKSISKKNGGDIDTSKDFIYTDWDAVDKFADEFLARLA